MSHPDDAAYVILLDDDVSQLRRIHVRLQEKLEKERYITNYLTMYLVNSYLM